MRERRRWLDDPRHVNRIVYGLYALCLALLVAEPLIHRKTYFAVQEWLGFYAVFGFLAYCGIVGVAKVLRRLVGRREDYYVSDHDRDEHRSDG